MKLIIVDDEINSLHLFLDHILGEVKDEYKFFKDDVENILSYCKENVVDGAFLDINMPTINGIDLADKIHDISPETKIIFVTGLNFSLSDLNDRQKEYIIGVIYKPFSEIDLQNNLAKITNQKRILKVKTIGSFDCFINDHIVRFTSTKSKELFALLIVMNGKSLSMEQAITFLWPDKNLDKAKILYRDAVWRLRNTLNEIGFNCVSFYRALLVLNKENIECDYYDILSGKDIYYAGNFLPSYDWSIDFENELDYIFENR